MAEPIGWVVEMIGSGSEGEGEDYFMAANNAYNSSSSSTSNKGAGSSSSSGSSSSKGGRNDRNRATGKGASCMHEDGGRYALFESTEGDPVSAWTPPSACHSSSLLVTLSSSLSPRHSLFVTLSSSFSARHSPRHSSSLLYHIFYKLIFFILAVFLKLFVFAHFFFFL